MQKQTQNPSEYSRPLREVVDGRAPKRVVCLVPSITEALFALNWGGAVVGVTDWCERPAEALTPVPRVGGTKNPDVRKIVALAPDLVIANHEENRRIDVDRLLAQGIRVWVTFPRSVDEALAMMDELVTLTGCQEAAGRLAGMRAEIEDTRTPDRHSEISTFCPIWRDPWMTPNGDTFIDDILRRGGCRNVAAGKATKRYPRIVLDEIVRLGPELILLPDEPYKFTEADVRELSDLDVPAAHNGHIYIVDGSLLSWYGPRMADGIKLVAGLAAKVRQRDERSSMRGELS